MPSPGPDAVFPVAFGAFFLVWLLIAALGLAATVFWIVELIDVCRREFPDPNTKIIWLLVVILVHGLGALVYYFVGKPQGWLPGEEAPPVRTTAQSGPWPPP